MLPLHSKDRLNVSLLSRIQDKLRGWLKLIISDSHSRSIFLFLLVNLSFAFVELFWGIWSNSLGLISDSFHMFFDCTGLLAGLAAALITKWKPNEKFSYGYVRAEVLAGFVNGLFLLFISFFIFSEAVERILEPPDVHHDRLLVVSVLGLLVNIFGIFVFHGHAHGHSHGGGSAGHGHSHLGNALAAGHSHGHHHGVSDSHHFSAFENGSVVTVSPFTEAHHGHSHDADGHGHGHSHDGAGHHGHSHGEAISGSDRQIMKGVFLHVLADTLGSVGVIISALLMKMFGWMIADPICSMAIASLIGLSVLPLIKDSACVLMMRSPQALDDVLPGCYQRLMTIEGVYSVQEPHFWTLCSDVYIGMLKLEVSPKCDPKYVTSTAHNIFAQVGIRQVFVQLDFAAV